jgi:hypothetical protein
MSWSDVGDWIKDNAGNGAALVGALLTGGSSAAIAMGVSMVADATGTTKPDDALEMLKNNPELMIKLEQIKNDRKAEVNRHIETMELARLKDAQAEHETTAKVVVEGQKAADHWIEKSVRPAMALASMVFSGFYVQSGSADAALLAIVIGPCFAWMGLRTIDKVKVRK